MIKTFAKLKAISIIILILIVISSEKNHSVFPNIVEASPTSPSADGELLVIDQVNIEAKVNNKFVPLEELISEAISPEFQDRPLPQLLNKTTLNINASYSTIIGRSESLVIHQFVVDIYSVTSEGNDVLNYTDPISIYYDPEDVKLDIVEFVLGPNSSKSEEATLPLELMLFGVYKFVFRVDYHILDVDTTIKNCYYYQNITFELVKSYSTPPYVIIYAFFGVLFIFIVLVIFGLYGDRKYKQLV